MPVTNIVFIDTEFTDLDRPRLISVGLAMDSACLHLVICQSPRTWRIEQCSDFVIDVVLPEMQGEDPLTVEQARARINAFIPADAVIAFDFDIDIVLLRTLMGPHWTWETKRVCPDQVFMDAIFESNPELIRHRADHDAIALMLASEMASGFVSP